MHYSLIEVVQRIFKDDLFVIVDGGARNGTKEVPRLHPLSCIFGFEPNAKEFAKLKSTPSSISIGRGTVINYPVALTKEDGEISLYITLRPGSTSTLIPDASYLKHFSLDNFSEMSCVMSEEKVPSMRLNTFMKKNSLNYIDLLKLDTQGNELDILMSSDGMIDKIEVIRTEVEFVPIYKNQPLFHDICNFLYKHGFELIDLQWSEACKRFHARSDLGPDAYRLVWGDAVFVRTPLDFSKERLFSQSIVLAEMGYRDLAIYQIRNNPRLNQLEKENLEHLYSDQYKQSTLKRRLRDFIVIYFGFKVDRCPSDRQVISMKKRP